MMLHIFRLSLLFSAFLSLALACFLIFVLRNGGESNARLLKKCETLPRAKLPGIVLSAVVILWCIPNIRPIISSETLNSLLFPLALISFILAVFFLDYLFARAFGVFLILLAHYFLKEAYPLGLKLHVLFASLTLLLGTLGICICGKPYWMRDLIRAFFQKPVWRWCASVYFLCFAFSTAFAAFQL